MLARIGEPPRPENADLRRGVIAIGLGLGLAAFGRPLIAIGSVPFLIGLAYLGLWRFGGNRD